MQIVSRDKQKRYFEVSQGRSSINISLIRRTCVGGGVKGYWGNCFLHPWRLKGGFFLIGNHFIETSFSYPVHFQQLRFVPKVHSILFGILLYFSIRPSVSPVSPTSILSAAASKPLSMLSVDRKAAMFYQNDLRV